MHFTGMWRRRFKTAALTVSALLILSSPCAAASALPEKQAAGNLSPAACAQGKAYTVGAGQELQVISPRILSCGQSPDGHGTYVVYSDDPGIFASYNPGLLHALEYTCRVRYDEAIGRGIVRDLLVSVYDTRRKEKLYTADISRMLQEVRADYGIGLSVSRYDGDGPGLRVRIDASGNEYLILHPLLDLTSGKQVSEEIRMDLDTGELVLQKECSGDLAASGSGSGTGGGTETGGETGTEAGKDEERIMQEYHREIRESSLLSTLYTNLLEQNGYAGVQAAARPDCYVLRYCPEEASVQNPHLTEYFSLPKDQSWELEPFVVCVFDTAQGRDYLSRALFGDPDRIDWEGAVIYGAASCDGRMHPIRSESDFYRWYRYDENGAPVGIWSRIIRFCISADEIRNIEEQIPFANPRFSR